MPAERRPVPAPQFCAPVAAEPSASMANAMTGIDGSSSVVQSTRQ